MKLLFVHERMGALAGAEANALVTAVAFKLRGHTVGLLHGRGTGQGEAEWRKTFANCFPLEAGGRSATVEAVLQQFAPEAIYVHKMADLEVLRALVASDTPLVRMVHDHDLYCMKSYKYHYLTRKICHRAMSPFCIFPCGAMLSRNRVGRFPVRWVSYAAKKKELQLNQQFDRMIVATEYMKEELLQNGFDASQIEVHAPVPPREDSGLRSSFNDRNRLIYAGQIIRGKGVDVLLEALARVRVPFECLILGEGNHRSHCEALCHQLGLAKRVHFEGFVPTEKLKEFYRESSLAVMSSVWPEPFGAVGLEAMRYGLPVVAFDAGGIREWLIDGHNGYLVPWMDREAFATRVEHLLLNKPLARQMGERALQTVATQFDFSKYIANLETVFRQVISEQHGAVPA
jgi:glycosyltransferase involved in cell wall biosynthesis